MTDEIFWNQKGPEQLERQMQQHYFTPVAELAKEVKKDSWRPKTKLELKSRGVSIT